MIKPSCRARACITSRLVLVVSIQQFDSACKANAQALDADRGCFTSDSGNPIACAIQHFDDLKPLILQFTPDLDEALPTPMVIKSAIYSSMLVALMAFQSTAAATKSSGCGKTVSITSGTYSATINGTERKYIVRVPESYDPSVAHPFIITYHWFGATAYNVTQNSSKYGNGSYYGLVDLANESTIFVSPQGLDNGWSNVNDDDMTFTDTIVQTIDDGLCVDTDQRFVVGFSFGGSMTNAVAKSGRGTTFKAAAVLSGTDYTTAIGEPVPIGFLVSHGISDPGNLISKGRSMRDVFLEVNGCSNQGAPEPVSGSKSHIKTTYENCSKPVTYIAFDGVHEYSPVDTGASTSWVSGELWNFFFPSSAAIGN